LNPIALGADSFYFIGDAVGNSFNMSRLALGVLLQNFKKRDTQRAVFGNHYRAIDRFAGFTVNAYR
jgi:hypothetical protein